MSTRAAAIEGRLGRVTLVTVTYGERANLLERTLASAAVAGVSDAVIVLNGCSLEATAEAEAVASSAPITVRVLALNENRGSAPGFSAGITAALQEASSGWLWLLDDDNEVSPQALERLAIAVGQFGAENRRVALFSCRLDRPIHQRLAAGVPPSRVFPSRSSFMNLNVRDLQRRIARRVLSPPGIASPVVPVPYGPYGGLLVERDVVRSTGLPNSALGLYEDDVEFTYRLSRSATLGLVPSSTIRDLAPSWYQAAAGRTPFERLLSAASDHRVFYAVRNRVYFESRLWKSSASLYALNRACFISALRATAYRQSRHDRYRLLRRALADGESGALGVADDAVTSPLD
jgi:GT2 family glycosyltransferase